MKLNGNIDKRTWADVYEGKDVERGKVKGNINTWADVYVHRNVWGK